MFYKISKQWLAVIAAVMLVFNACTIYAEETCECGDATFENVSGTGSDCGYASMCRSIIESQDISKCIGNPTDGYLCTVTDGEILSAYECTMTVKCPKSGPASIQGKVEIASVTRSNTPVPGALVSAYTDKGDTKETTTDADGSFTLGNLSNDLWFVQAEPPADDAYKGYGKTKPLGVDLGDKNSVTLPDPLVLPRVDKYRGKVILPDGTPVSGAYIFAETQNYDRSESVQSNADGNFSLTLSDGLWRIYAKPPENDSNYIKYIASEPIKKEVPSTTDIGPLKLRRGNHISGTVKFRNIGFPNITVAACNWESEDGYREVLTDRGGQFEMWVGSGTWYVRAAQDQGTEWFSSEPEPVIFVEETSGEESVNIVLESAATEGGRWVGRIVGPAGETIENPGESISIGATRTDGDLFFQTGGENEIAEREVYPDEKGNFSFPLPEGIYEIWVWIDSEKYPDYAAPSSQMVKIITGKEEDAGDIKLKKRGATVQGSLLDSQEKGIPEISVEAWNPETEEWFQTQTDAFGLYRFRLSSGLWYITVFIPDRFLDLSKEVEVAESDITLDPFVLENAEKIINPSSVITGVVQDENGLVLSEVEAVAYARVGDEIFHVSESWVSDGNFTLNVSDADVSVGLYLPPGSSYTYSGEQVVSPGETVSFQVMKNQTLIQGKLIDNKGNAVTDVAGYVFATSGDFWQYGEINTQDGSYEIPAGQGTWMLSYEIESEKYMSYSPTPIPVEVKEGDTTVAQDITLNYLDGVIQGQVQDPDGNPVPDIQVWVRSPSDKRTGKSVFEAQVVTDSEGRFKFFVPMDDPSASTLRDTERGWGKPYNTGTTSQNCAWLTGKAQEDCYKAAAEQSTWPYNNKRSSDEREDEVVLVLRKADTSLKGKVFAEDGKTPVKDAYISAYSGDGQRAEGYTDANGEYSLQIARADTAEGNSWTIRAAYNAYKPTGENAYYRSADVSHDISGTETDVDLTLASVGILPPTESYEFQVANGWLHAMSDGTVINIPGYGVRTQKKTVKIVIEPRIKGLPDTGNDRTLVYGYAIKLYEKESRKEITEKFEKPATLTFVYKDDMLKALGVQEANLRPAYFSETVQNWQPINAFTADTSGNKITFRTDHFSVYALVEAISEGKPGDMDGDDEITLKDIISALQVCTNDSQFVSLKADVNGDGKIGLPEALYIFRNLAETPTH